MNLEKVIFDTDFRTYAAEINENYGRLSNISIVGYIPYYDKKQKLYKRPVVQATCSCGNTVIVRLEHLKSGATKSCGCLAKESKSIVGKRNLLANGESAFTSIYQKYKGRHNARTKEPFISKEDFRTLTSKNCTYCGAVPSNKNIKGDSSYTYQGLDRIDSNKGYTIDNVVPCCIVCNRAKNNMKHEEFLSWIQNLTNTINNK